jgi:hypothetical protein
MVNDLRDRVDLWLQRTEKDMKSFDGQGYIYGLRMFTAFAHVLKHCLLAHKVDASVPANPSSASAPASAPNYFSCCAPAPVHVPASTSASVLAPAPNYFSCCAPAPVPVPASASTSALAHSPDAQFSGSEEIYLTMRNEIAQNRCNCEECVRLKRSNKLHLASLPIWLCMNYHKKGLKLHHVEKRKEELIKMFDGFPAKLLNASEVVDGSPQTKFTADLFCVWPHCKTYEMKRYKYVVASQVEPADPHEAVNEFLKNHSDFENCPFMVVKIDMRQQNKKFLFDVLVARTIVARTTARWRSNFYDFNDDGSDYDFFSRLYKSVVDNVVDNGIPDDEGAGEDTLQHKKPCSANFLVVDKLCLLLKILEHSVTHQNKGNDKLTAFVEKEKKDQKIPATKLFLNIAQKFGTRAKDEDNAQTFGARAKDDDSALNQKLLAFLALSDGCVECFRDECISFMSDLRHLVSEGNDYDHYSKYQDTIAQFVGNIKIDLSPMSTLTSNNDGVENAIIQW